MPFFPVFAFYVLSKKIWTPVFIYCAFEAPFKIFYVFGFIYRTRDSSNYEMKSAVLGIYCLTEFMFLFWAVIIFKIVNFEKLSRISNFQISPIKLKRLVIFSATLFIVSFITLAEHSFGLVNWLQNPRAGYLYHREGAGIYYALALSSLSLMFIFSILSAKSILSWFTTFLTCLFIGYFLGTKDLLITQTQCFFMILWFRHPRLAIKLTIIGAPISAALLALLFVISNQVDVVRILTYFDYFHNAYLFYSDYFAGKVSLFYGQVMWSDYWSYVPRSIYPSKPYIYGPVLVADLYYPGAAKSGAYPAFGAGVFQFADFGWLGIMLLTSFDYWSWFFAALFVSIRLGTLSLPFTSNIRFFSLIIMLSVYAPKFGLFFPGLLFLILLILTVISVSLTTRLNWR